MTKLPFKLSCNEHFLAQVSLDFSLVCPSQRAFIMIEHFLGTWKLVSSENFEEYMKELGEKGYSKI